MANKINKGNPQRPQPVAQKKETSVPVPFFPDLKMPDWVYEFKVQAIVVAVLSILLYANTFRHEYALDDTIVIAKNEYVYEGFAGIGSILTKDAFDSYYKQFNSSNQLSGGRYRPLSIVTFAIEQQFLGPIPAGKVLDSVVAHAGEAGPQEEKFNRQMQTRHVLQVGWFAMSMVVLLLFLRYVVFKKNPLVAFITALLFIAHPVHTEVIANVKSRDEIMSLMFIGLTFISAFKYYEKNDKKWLGLGMLFYLLAFLSKEYAVSLIILMPLAFYLFNDFSMSKSLSASLPYFGVMAVYMVIRLQIVAPMSEDSVNDILNNPYALADEQQQLATKISTTLNYLKLLIFPHPLSADYSYNTIPYSDFTNIMVWVSLIVHILIIRYFFYFLKRRHVLSFAIAFYIGNLLLINNIIFNIGGTMGERLIYHSSLGFCMAVAYGLNMGVQKIGAETMGRVALAGSLLLVIGLFSFKTIDRNQYWKNDHTLFFEDIKVAPNSVLVNADVASSYVNMSDYIKDEKKKEESIRNGIKYFSRAIEINPAFVSGYLNRGMAYFKLKVPDSAIYNLKKVQELYPRYPKLDEMFFNVGVNFYVEQKFPQAIDAWQHSLKSNPQYPQALNALAVMRKEGRMR